MSDENQSEEIKKAIEAYEKKRSLSTSIFLAVIGAVVALFYFSNPFLMGGVAAALGIGYGTVPLVAAAGGALIGFFLIELFSLALLVIVATFGYFWFQSAYVSGDSYSVTVSNNSLKNLSIRVGNPVVCGTWKPDKTSDLVVSILPGETKKVFNGCRASEFEYSVNGVSPYGPFRSQNKQCLEIVSNVHVTFDQSGWVRDQSMKHAFDDVNKGAIRDCKT